MVPLLLFFFLLSGVFLQADHSNYHVAYSSDKDLTLTVQGGTRYVAPNLFTANKYAYAPDGRDPFAINGYIGLNAGGPSPYSSSSGKAQDFALDQKTCGLLTVTTKSATRFTFLCRESTYSFELATSLSKLTPSFYKAGHSQLVLGMDDASNTFFVLNSNTPVPLVQTVFRHFFDEGASTSIPAACEISISSDLKFLLLSCDLSKLNQGGPGTAPQPSFRPLAETKGTVIQNPGPLARENPLATHETVTAERAADLRFDSDVFQKNLFWAVPFAPDDEYKGTKVYDLCNAQLLDVGDDHNLKLKLLEWVRSVKESKDTFTKAETKERFVSGKQCSGLISPIKDPVPRKDKKGDYWYNAQRPASSSNPDGHHEGVDIKGALDTTPVLAPADGVVQDYGAGGSCGIGVLLRHDCTVGGQVFWTKFCHLSVSKGLPVKPGQRVKKGDVIGYVGISGNADDPEMVPHLHVEYLSGGELRNKYLSGAKDFDPVSKGFLPKTLGKPGTARTPGERGSVEVLASLPSLLLSFSPLKLPTRAEFVSSYFPNVVYDVADNPCGSDSDANGFFGMRIRKLNGQNVEACAHAGIDFRGKRNVGSNVIYSQPVKAMLPGRIVRIKKGYQSGWNDYVVVIDSGDWVVSYGHIRVVNTLRKGQSVTAGQVVGYPFRSPDAYGVNREFQAAYGGELDVKILYKGTDPALKALTVKELKKNPAYKRFFTPDTLVVFRGSDFTFNVPNYDDYFLWEKYTGKETAGTTPPVQTPQSEPAPPASVPSSGPTTSNPPVSQSPSQTVDAKGPFSDKPLLCIFYSTDKKYEDLVFHLIRKDADGREKVIRQKRCTYSEDNPPKTQGRTVACNEQNDAGFHSIFWDTRFAEYNPSKTGEYLDRGKTYFLRMIGSFIQGNRKTAEQIGGHSFIQSATGMYREDVTFGNLVLSFKNKALPIKVFVDGALVAFSAQDEISISLPVGKHKLNVCKFDGEIEVGSAPLKKDVDCQGFSYASAAAYSSDAAKAFVQEASTWVGTPYKWEAPSKGPAGAADCSGLVLGSYNNVKARFRHAPLDKQFCNNGNLPRTADMQYGCLRSTGNLVKSWNEVQAGDLIFQLNTYNGGGAGQAACTFQLAASGLTDTSNPACVMACDLQQASTRIALTPDLKSPGKFCGVPTHVFIAADKPQLDASGKPIYVRAIEASGHGSFVKEIENRDIRGYNLLVGRIPWISTGGTSTPPATPGSGGKTVYLGLNHDYCNSGASLGRLNEAVEIFRVSLKIKEKLEVAGYTVIFSKEWVKKKAGDFQKIASASSSDLASGCSSDNSICRVLDQTTSNPCSHPTADIAETREFKSNAELAKLKGASIGIAPHFDATPGKRVVFYHSRFPKSQELAVKIANAMSAPQEPDSASGKGGRKGYLEFPKFSSDEGIPAVTIELDRLGAEGVGSEAYADRMAESIVKGIKDYLGSTTPVVDGKKKVEFNEVLATTYCIGESGVGGVGSTAGGRIKCPDRTNLFVALPAPMARLKGKQVEVCFQSKCVQAPVEDVGPWCINDGAYVFEGARPFAETLGRKSASERAAHGCSYSQANGAGIDLSLALAKAIGYPGSPNKVRWRFVS